MLTIKENLFETMKKGGKPDRWVKQYEFVYFNPFDPITAYTLKGRNVRGAIGTDDWGVTYSWPAEFPGATPLITEENKAIKDITKWRDQVKVPDLVANCSNGWEAALEHAAKCDRNEQLVTGFMHTGMFEQTHFLMGFEDTFINLMTEPEHMKDLLQEILKYRMTMAKLLIDKMNPDAILSHDDWGSKTSLFMSPDMWREFYKPLYAELYAYIKSRGVMVIHHADSFCEPIAEDMAEIGVDIWQGVLYTNDIPKILEKLDGRMTLMGGIDSGKIDRDDSTPEEICAETRRAVMEYGGCPHYIPSYTYGGPNDLMHPENYAIIDGEIDRCNAELFGKL